MDTCRRRRMTMDQWPLVLIVTTGAIAGAMLFWLARYSRPAMIAFAVALVPGGLAGALILDQASQPGFASLNGFLVSVGLGAVALGTLVAGLLVRRVRASALSVSASLVLAAVFTSQLLAYLSSR